MKIDHEFTVPATVDRAWEVLTDLELIAPCMPGAMLTGVEGDTYSGKLKVKVGPVVSEFAGTATFVEKDAVAHVAVIDAKARDARGAGNASATITARLRADGANTIANVETDMKISGKLAQFGSGMIKEVSGKLLDSFVGCLATKISDAPVADVATESVPAAAAEPPPATASEAPKHAAPAPVAVAESAAPVTAPPAQAATTPVPTATTLAPQPEPEALDLLDLAGNSVAKRFIPVAVGIGLVVVAIVVYVATR